VLELGPHYKIPQVAENSGDHCSFSIQRYFFQIQWQEGPVHMIVKSKNSQHYHNSKASPKWAWGEWVIVFGSLVRDNKQPLGAWGSKGIPPWTCSIVSTSSFSSYVDLTTTAHREGDWEFLQKRLWRWCLHQRTSLWTECFCTQEGWVLPPSVHPLQPLNHFMESSHFRAISSEEITSEGYVHQGCSRDSFN